MADIPTGNSAESPSELSEVLRQVQLEERTENAEDIARDQVAADRAAEALAAHQDDSE